MRQKVVALSLLIFGMGLSGLNAQVAIPATGGNISGSGGSVSFSVGQVVIFTNFSSDGSVAQGVQQPYEVSSVTDIEEHVDMQFVASVYPNPTEDILYLKVDLNHIDDLIYQLLDVNGSLLETRKPADNITGIFMGHLVPSVYFLIVKKETAGVKVFKIIKR